LVFINLNFFSTFLRYTKMGFAGNDEPQFIIPTALTGGKGKLGGGNKQQRGGLEDLSFESGWGAIEAGKRGEEVHYPIRHGQVENWDLMESYWQHCIFKYMQCDPESHYFMLTEPPLNAPENREYTAEIMFETFNVPGLYIAVQAVLALAASWTSKKTTSSQDIFTGTVIDSGDGVTHVIPVVEGYAIGSAIKHIPLAGRDVTHFVQQLLRDRVDLNLAPEMTLEAARRIKESEFSYVAPNLAREFAAHDREDPAKLPTIPIWDSVRGKDVHVQIGYERFLAGEAFFNPELVSSEHLTPLPTLVDQVIQACPMDCRRALYGNIVLSGGSTLFKDFSRRLQRDLRSIVDGRLQYIKNIRSDSIATGTTQPIAVKVLAHENQRHAVYTGGSFLASLDAFPSYCHSKAEYDEFGPNICRQSRIFSNLQ
jgi:actin-related protein 3